MSVRRCQQEVDSQEFSEWLAMAQLSPWGPRRVDWLFAHQTAHIVAALTGNKQHPRDYLPQWAQKARTPDEIKNEIRNQLGIQED